MGKTAKYIALKLICVAVVILQSCKDGKQESDESSDKFADNIRVTDFQTPEEEQASFKLPPGFEITLFASEPDISKPINMEFDEKGRLWVTNTVEYPMPARGWAGRDRITILEDTDGDGKADKFTHFEDTLNIPIGITPVHNGAVAYSIPNVYRFTDNDGDGKADSSKKLLGPFEFIDTHGMVNNLIRGWDGWIYACHGYANNSIVAGADGDSIRMISGNTFRFREDGSRVETTTLGRINPFGYAYDEWGYLYSLDCHTKPIYQLIPGAQYPSQGVREPTIGWAPEMMSYEFGSTANSGLVYYTGEQFPEVYRNNFFSGNVVTSRVNRNTMTFHGSSPESKREEDFLTTSDPWFRPVDLKTGPDGSIYVADFYNRIIGHYEVPKEHPGRDRTSGRIWKITYTGKTNNSRTIPKDLTKVSLDELVKALNFPQLNIRMTVANYIVDHYGQKAVVPVKNMMDAPQADHKSFVQGMWILFRLNALPAETLDKTLVSADPILQVHALRVLIALNKISPAQREQALNALKSTSPQVQRMAVEVLGHFPELGNLEPLLAIHDKTPERDSHLRYAAILAIRDNLRNNAIMNQLAKQKWNDDQLRLLIKVMPEVPSKEAAAFTLDYLQTHDLPQDQLVTNLSYIGRYIATDRLSLAINVIRKKATSDPNIQYTIYETIRQGIAQRGIKINNDLRQWGISIAGKLLENKGGQNAWTSRLMDPAGNLVNPWGISDKPAQNDFPAARYLSSERRGGDPTGIARSPSFKLPESLSMVILDNDVNRTEEKKGRSLNAVRIKLDKGDKVIAEFRYNLKEKSPNDAEICKHRFDLSKYASQTGYLELIDSSKKGGIAITGIESAISAIPEAGPGDLADQQIKAAAIAADYEAKELEPVLQQLLGNSAVDAGARAAAADALMAISPQNNQAAVKAVFFRREEYPALKEKLARTLGQLPSSGIFPLLENELNGAPRNLQLAIVQVLSGAGPGIDYLLKSVQSGKVNVDLLEELPVKENLNAHANTKQQQALQQLMAGRGGLADRKQLIEERLASFNPSSVTVEAGHAVFIQNCSMCHKIDGEGGTIGPTLGGIGTWGQKALTEKILNPNGSISAPYRTYNLILKDGKRLSGLYRREEGALTVFADFGGKEFSVPTADIKEKTALAYTLMPNNFSKSIARKDFDALLKYLLSIKDKK